MHKQAMEASEQPPTTTEQAPSSAAVASPSPAPTSASTPAPVAWSLTRQDGGSQHDSSFVPAPQGRHGPYNMMPMMSALPHVQRIEHHHHHHHMGQPPYHPPSNPPAMHLMPQVAHYGTGPAFNMPSPDFYAQQHQLHPPITQYYHHRQLSPQVQPMQDMPYYSNQMVVGHPQTNYYSGQPNRYPAPNQGRSGQYTTNYTPPPTIDPRFIKSSSDGTRASAQSTKSISDASQRRPSEGIVRGPPRKPRQSGHAIWIGNLPPQTDLMNLVNHVYSLIPGLESLFLISKSNCAFANFQDDDACVEAQQKIHDSRFQSIRLVSRLRKNTADNTSDSPVLDRPPSPEANTPIDGDQPSVVPQPELDASSPPVIASSLRRGSAAMERAQQDRFFILKSLTVRDLELSVKTGIWATQSHNEQNLNNAFKTTDNVYLVFSANKSGEYFGYARMLSEIDEDPAAAIEFAPSTQSTDQTDLPKEIITEATEFAPPGQIIDDSARGTIFWQLQRAETETESDKESDVGSTKEDEQETQGTKTWGKPFKLEWLCTNRMPFYKARGLRNPWNANREVKIARDGTEIEPIIGKRLIGMFNRHQRSGPFVVDPRLPMSPTGMAPGFPPVRPYWP